MVARRPDGALLTPKLLSDNPERYRDAALAITRVFIHPLAGVLSAYGMGLADLAVLREHAMETRLEEAAVAALEARLEALVADARAELVRKGVPGERGRNYVLRKDGEHVELGPLDTIEMRAGDTFVIETPGGGGFGSTA